MRANKIRVVKAPITNILLSFTVRSEAIIVEIRKTTPPIVGVFALTL